jgi:hypothetical protein
MRGRLWAILALVALTGGVPFRAQAPNSAPRVWRGDWQEQFIDERNGIRSLTTIDYRLTEGTDANGLRTWTARTVHWSYRWDMDKKAIAMEERPPDDRGFTLHRFEARIQKTCTTAGTIDLGATFGTDTVLSMPAGQEDRLQSRCVTEQTNLETGAVTRSTSTGDRFALPRIPNDEEFRGCQFADKWRTDRADGSYYEGTFTVTRAADLAAVMNVDTSPGSEYADFVPVPGRTLTFLASVASGKARFRFELDPEATSHFPGYATNAAVDEALFVRHGLTHLSSDYSNIGPDYLFDRAAFDRGTWSRIEPLVVETSAPQDSGGVTVTAMDYGAVGRLRAFVSSPDCGGWQPVPITVGATTREFVDLPLDEDGNLMADALPAYRGIDPGADADAEPRGNGIAGDGLTAFEEYRGFLVRGSACPGDAVGAAAPGPGPGSAEAMAWSEDHIRSVPHHKNLFVHTPDPELAVLLEGFAWSTDLSVQPICAARYVDNDTRVVNFTLQNAGLRTWRGKTISQPDAQHGLWVQPVEDLEDVLAVALPATEGAMGPPGLTKAILVQKAAPVARTGVDQRIAAYLTGALSSSQMDVVLRHELGHAVGVPHHGDDVVDWKIQPGLMNVIPLYSPIQGQGGPPDFALFPSLDALRAAGPDALMVSPGRACREEDLDAVFKEGKFAGCVTQKIVRRGQQNSGLDTCPMRYAGSDGDFYEAPGSTAAYVWTGEVVEMGYSSYSGPVERGRVVVDEWKGDLLRYKEEYEQLRLNRFCATIAGTGLNALPGDQNHAGDAGRNSRKACRDHLVIKDGAARTAQ